MIIFFRLLHTKRLRREIARLEQMEKEIAIKTTQISEMVTPEPKSRNGWTPGSSSRRENRSDSQVHHANKILLIYYVTFFIEVLKRHLNLNPYNLFR